MTAARLVQIAALLSLTACATHPRASAVDMRMILPDGARRIELQHDQRFLMPVPIDHPLPAVPADIAETAWTTTTVCVEIVVGSDGIVESATPLAAQEDCSDASSGVARTFMQEALHAVRGWTFFGAAICRPATPGDERCEQAASVVEPVPVKLAYGFTFVHSRDGASVRASGIRAAPTK